MTKYKLVCNAAVTQCVRVYFTHEHTQKRCHDVTSRFGPRCACYDGNNHKITWHEIHTLETRHEKRPWQPFYCFHSVMKDRGSLFCMQGKCLRFLSRMRTNGDLFQMKSLNMYSIDTDTFECVVFYVFCFRSENKK